MLYENKEGIKILEQLCYDFSNGLDQQIHGLEYEQLLSVYQSMCDTICLLKEHSNYQVDIIEGNLYSSFHLIEKENIKLIEKNQKSV